MRILIAEDEVATAKALKLLLEKSKYSVDIVHTGTDAFIRRMKFVAPYRNTSAISARSNALLSWQRLICSISMGSMPMTRLKKKGKQEQRRKTVSRQMVTSR